MGRIGHVDWWDLDHIPLREDDNPPADCYFRLDHIMLHPEGALNPKPDPPRNELLPIWSQDARAAWIETKRRREEEAKARAK